MKVSITSVSERKSDYKLNILFVSVVSALMLVIYFMKLEFVMQLTVELALVALIVAISIISYLTGENMFVQMYRNLKGK